MAYIERTTINDVFLALKHILNTLIRPLWMEQSTGRLRVVVEAGTLPTVTTLGTLSNLGTGNVSGLHIDRMSWANSVRSRIS